MGFVGFQGGRTANALQLERENAILTAELGTIQARVHDLEGELSFLADRDREFRTLAGLDQIDEEVLQVGIGGPGSPSLEEHPLHEVDPETGARAFAVAYDLNALERRSRLLRESLLEASDSLAAHRDLLESTPSILPTDGFLSSGFTQARVHPIHNQVLPHEGIDVSAPMGTPILAAAKGRVAFAGQRDGYGLVVEIDHGFGYVTLYGHASRALVTRGQQVARGDLIAQVGRSGIATSPHLHYEVRVNDRPVNPMRFVITGAVP
jgi:murein DD-endopeptidase MepM/ murein hydrolase activator NlpD